MKTVVCIMASILLGIIATYGQTPQKNSSVDTSKNTISFNLEDDYFRTYTFLDLDDSYRIKIRFMKHMISNVHTYLNSQFGEADKVDRSGYRVWEKGLEENYIHEVKLKGNKLRIRFNKEKANEKDVKRIEKIANELKAITARPE